MRCAVCHEMIGQGARFCGACGAPVPVACAVCGALNPPGMRFCSQCGAGLAGGRAAPAPQTLMAEVAAAERRQLTVLFCDLVGSTALSSRLDPEDVGALTRAYQLGVTEAMARFGGFVAQYQGDGVLVYFGWPHATEAASEQAVLAALAARDAVASRLFAGEALRVRIGIATGLVVVDGGPDAGRLREPMAVGEAPNRAARLQALAQPGSIVIDAATRRLVGELFDLEAIGPVDLKGLPEPVEAFEVRGEFIGNSRFEALHAAELTPLVGRQEELDLLLRRWDQARQGQGRVVLIAGEPGLGKSRLVAELEERLARGPCARIRLFCAPHAIHTPLYPVIRQIEFDAGFTRDDSPAERAAKLRRRLEAMDAEPEDIALITAMLHLPDDGLPRVNLSPQRRKERTFAALLRWAERRSKARPVLLVFEDIHWADPSTRELLDDLVRRVGEWRALLVVTFRPEFVAPWAGHAGVTLITLSRLERGETAVLSRQLAAQADLPERLLDQIVAQSDGVPLFVEELTKAVLETPPTERSATLPVAVPSTLQASLIARLDRMPAARQVAQVGSVIGRRFSRTMLGEVAGLPAATLDEGLDQLVAAGLLFRRGEGEEAAYIFKHALVQDVAYNSLLRARRAALHAAIGAVLERDPDTAASRPALLGHHFDRAGDPEKACRWYLRAGEQSAAASAMAEAEAHLARGLELAAEIASVAKRDRLRAELTITLGNVHMAVQGVGSPAHKMAFAEAVGLCRSLDPREPMSARLLARALFGQWTYELQSGHLARALEIGRLLYEAGRDSPDPELRAAASGHAVCYMFLGRIEEGLAVFAAAVADAGIRARMPSTMDFGFDPTCHLYAQYGRTLALRGCLEQARAHLAFALERARELQHLPTTCLTLMAGCTAAWIARDLAALDERSQALVRIATEQGYGFWRARGMGYAGWLRAAGGAHEDGRAMLDEALREFGAMGIWLSGPHTRAMRADVQAWRGYADLADRDIDDALAICGCTGEVWPEAELYRRKGELHRADAVAAEALFRQATAIARGQGAGLFELRATASLARLWHEQGRSREARGLLAPVHGRFTEGFGAPDLVEAQELMDALGAR